jgi:hypothetical protein
MNNCEGWKKSDSPEEKNSIVGSRSVKICMKLEDTSESLEGFNKAVIDDLIISKVSKNIFSKDKIVKKL